MLSSTGERPRVATYAEGNRLRFGEANVRAMLKEERATTQSQFLIAGLITQDDDEGKLGIGKKYGTSQYSDF